MTTQEAVDFFGSVTSLSSAMGLTRDAVYKWGKYPPNETQYKIMVLSGGRLAVTNDNTKQENNND